MKQILILIGLMWFFSLSVWQRTDSAKMAPMDTRQSPANTSAPPVDIE
jgi:hypothetical protein